MPVPDFQALFEALPGLYLVLLPDEPHFTIVAVNAAFASATLTEPDEIIGRGLFEVLPDNPEERNATGVSNTRASLRKVLATKTRDTMPPRKYDIRRPNSEGGGFEERFWSAVNFPVLDRNGGIEFIVHHVEHLVEDISGFLDLKRKEAEHGRLAEAERMRAERAQIEQELRESERRFSVAFAEAPIGMVLTSTDGVILDVNRAFLNMVGYTLEELVSLDSSHFTHPDDIAPTRAFYASLREQPRGSAIIEKRYIRKDGQVVWVRASASMRADSQGKATQLIAIIEDITERKLAETALRQQWHTFDTALSNTPDFTYIFDLRGRFTYLNQALLALLQRTLEDAVGKNFFELGHPPEISELLQRQIQEVIDNRLPLRAQTPFTGPTGETRDYEYILSPVFGADGQVDAVAGSTRDITERSRVEEALRTSEERVTWLSRRAGGWVPGIGIFLSAGFTAIPGLPCCSPSIRMSPPPARLWSCSSRLSTWTSANGCPLEFKTLWTQAGTSPRNIASCSATAPCAGSTHAAAVTWTRRGPPFVFPASCSISRNEGARKKN